MRRRRRKERRRRGRRRGSRRLWKKPRNIRIPRINGGKQ